MRPPAFSPAVWVVFNPAGGLDIKEPGAQRVVGHAASQGEAVRIAPSFVAQGGRVQIYADDGRLECTIPVEALRRVWWEVSPGLLAAGVLLILSSYLRLAGDGSLKWIALLTLLMGLFAVVAGVMSIRRRRHLNQAAVQNTRADGRPNRPSFIQTERVPKTRARSVTGDRPRAEREHAHRREQRKRG